MKRQSFLTCNHVNVQSFTDYCLDCGYNLWMTEEEYKKRLEEEVKRAGLLISQIDILEKALGIEK